MRKKKIDQKRRDSGKYKEVIMPVPPTSMELTEGYGGFLQSIKKRIKTESL